MSWNLLRGLTPLGRGVLIAGVVATLGLILSAGLMHLGLSWDPFGRAAQRLEQAEARAAIAQSDALARGLEVEGERDLRSKAEIQYRRVSAAEAVTVAIIQHSGTADDASVPLESARAARLLAHDRELCRIAPDLDGCPAKTGPG